MKIWVAVVTLALALSSFGAPTQGYNNVKIKRVMLHFGYIVLQADSLPGSRDNFTDAYFIVPKTDNDLCNRKEMLSILLSAQTSGAKLVIWAHAATLDAGAGVVGQTLYSAQIIAE